MVFRVTLPSVGRIANKLCAATQCESLGEPALAAEMPFLNRAGMLVAYAGETGVTTPNLFQPDTIKYRFFPLAQSPWSVAYFQ